MEYLHVHNTEFDSRILGPFDTSSLSVEIEKGTIIIVIIVFYYYTLLLKYTLIFIKLHEWQ